MKTLRSQIDILARGRLIFGLAVLLGVANVHGQSDADPESTAPPSGALLSPAPPFSQWTVTFSYAEEPKTPDASKPVPDYVALRPRTIVVTKTREIIHEETTTVGGKKTEGWQVHGNYYVRYPGNNYWSAYEKTDGNLDVSRARAALVLPDSGFSGLDWINKDTYAGKMKTSAGDNLVFVPGGMSTVNAGDVSGQAKLQSLPTVAYISLETRLPVTVRDKGETRQYAFSQSPPSEMQVLPPDLADEIKKGDQIRALRSGAPKLEY